MPDSGRPIFLGGKLFGDSAVLSGRELAGVKHLVVATATGANGPLRDADGHHYRDYQQGEQDADSEPPAGQRRAFLNQAVQQLVNPLVDPLRHRAFGVDRLVEFALGSLVRGVTADVDSGHPRMVPIPAVTARGSRSTQLSR